ncbi:protein LvrA [Legionella beliardensis]|uniref:Protein LvrA n=1 Tax=Legionella beliardensis TaxID=91822 RepID=A0A378I462_9GAMM|nr:protein LvrA [Legionella beliardensis]
MDFLFINRRELDALIELPLIQRVVYIMGIRPYMDRATFIVGIKRRISYQSLRETCYVAPIPGVKAEYPSYQQMKRVVKSLARVGLLEIRSTPRNLIVRCLLADTKA